MVITFWTQAVKFMHTFIMNAITSELCFVVPSRYIHIMVCAQDGKNLCFLLAANIEVALLASPLANNTGKNNMVGSLLAMRTPLLQFRDWKRFPRSQTANKAEMEKLNLKQRNGSEWTSPMRKLNSESRCVLLNSEPCCCLFRHTIAAFLRKCYLGYHDQITLAYAWCIHRAQFSAANANKGRWA